MIKSLRTYYLDALGISQYSLKRKLPPYSAETPSSKVFSNSLGEKITVRSSSDIGSAVAETTKSSHNNVQLDGALNQKPIGINVSHMLSRKGLDLSHQPRHSLAFWQPSAGMLVCSETLTRDSGCRQLELLKNIIYVVTSELISLLEPEIIEWSGSLESDGGDTKVRDFFADRVNNLIQLSEIKRLLIFGSKPKLWLLNDEQIAALNEGRCFFSERTTVAVLPSLPKMLENRELKRQAWEVLRARPHLGEAAFS